MLRKNIDCNSMACTAKAAEETSGRDGDDGSERKRPRTPPGKQNGTEGGGQHAGKQEREFHQTALN